MTGFSGSNLSLQIAAYLNWFLGKASLLGDPLTCKNLSPGILRFSTVVQVLFLPAGMIALQTRKEAIRRASASVR